MSKNLYRIIERKYAGHECPIYVVEVFKRAWYWPFKKTWQDAISWEECGVGVPYFYSFEKAEEYIRSVNTPVEYKVVYEDKYLG